jgi:2-dehydropantoate 2-reductase
MKGGSVAVVGAGAVGGFFGGMLARAGVDVTLVGREPHVSAITKGGLRIQSLRFDERVRVHATEEIAATRGKDAVLVCVKTLDTAAAARALAPHVTPATLVVSLQNGVENVAVMKEAGVGALPAVVYVAAALAGPGHVHHTGRGDLVLQSPPAGGDGERHATFDLLVTAFERAGVPCRVTPDAGPDLWMKLVLNCAFNAISALGQAQYARIAADPGARATLERAVAEAAAVARASGVRLPTDDPAAAAWKLAEAMPQATSSTAQDLVRGKRTEIDALNGFVARKGAALGVDTPVNQALWALVRLLEERPAADRASRPGGGGPIVGANPEERP